MPSHFIIFSLFSLLYFLAILCLTYFFIYKKVKLHLHHIIAVGAGILITLVFFDFLPHSLDTGIRWYNIIIILAGFLVNAFAEIVILPRIKFLNRLLPDKQHDCHQHDSEHTHYHLIPSSAGCSVVSCLILCAFFDGARLASALFIDVETAIMMGIGLLFHLLPECIAVVGIGLSSGFSRKFLLSIPMVFCFAFLGGYHIFFLLSYIPNLQTLFLPFASGLFLYVCFVHFIPIVIKFKKTFWFFIGATAGAAFLLLPHLMLHH